MTALADALVAAQRRALSAMEKNYVAERLDGEQARTMMDEIGLTDDVDQDRLIAALDVIRDYGAALPAETNGAPPKTEPATTAQRERIKRDVAKLHGDDAASSLASEPTLTKAQASEIISSIVAGTFEIDKWAVPF